MTTPGHDELHTALSDLEALLAKGTIGQVRLTGDGELIISPLIAENLPAEGNELRSELAAMVPHLPLASVLVEVDARTGFTDYPVYAGAKANRPVKLKRILVYVIIAEATTMGLTTMSERSRAGCHMTCWLDRPVALPARVTRRTRTTTTGSR